MLQQACFADLPGVASANTVKFSESRSQAPSRAPPKRQPDTAGSPTTCVAGVESACSLLQYGLATNLLRWAGRPEALDALGLGPAAEGLPGGLPDLIWRAAYRSLGPGLFLGGALALAGLPVAPHCRRPPGARASMENLIPGGPPLQPGSPPSPLARGVNALGAGDAGGRAPWQQQLQAEFEPARASASPAVRLLFALHMASAGAGALAAAAAAAGEREGGDEPGGALGRDGARDAGAMVMQLLLPAGQLLQAQLHAARGRAAQQCGASAAAAAAAGGGGSLGGGGQLPEGLAPAFCRVVQVGGRRG